MTTKPLHLCPGFNVEVPCTRRGKPSYRWAMGWTEISPGGVSNPLPLREWQALAKRDGQKIRRHLTATAALDAQRQPDPAAPESFKQQPDAPTGPEQINKAGDRWTGETNREGGQTFWIYADRAGNLYESKEAPAAPAPAAPLATNPARVEFLLTLTADNEGDPVNMTGRGATFGAAAVALLSDMLATFGALDTPIFEAIAALSYEREETFRHEDFSTPEDNFTLVLSYVNAAHMDGPAATI